MKLEECIICEEHTGRAGRFDDSIFLVYMVSVPELNIEEGEEVGPICGSCANCLISLGIADD